MIHKVPYTVIQGQNETECKGREVLCIGVETSYSTRNTKVSILFHWISLLPEGANPVARLEKTIIFVDQSQSQTPVSVKGSKAKSNELITFPWQLWCIQVWSNGLSWLNQSEGSTFQYPYFLLVFSMETYF